MGIRAGLTCDPNEIGSSWRDESWITPGPRATDTSLNPQPDHRVTPVDAVAEVRRCRAAGLDVNNVRIQTSGSHGLRAGDKPGLGHAA